MIIRKLCDNSREYGEIDSTNEEMSRLLGKEELEEGTVVRTNYQSRGKGHQENTWVSERGMNLLFSILLKPEFLPAEDAFFLSRIVSLSLVDIIDKQGIRRHIKWPNDILVGTGKICGILIENSILRDRISHSVIGVGLNVNQKKFDAGIPDPTSMLLEKGCQFGMNLLLNGFRSALEGWYQVLQSGHKDQIMDAYLKNLYLLKEPAEFSDQGGVFTASIIGVLPSGELEVLLEGGEIRRYGFKEIEYLRPV
ncbi:biotin--[acetyl-CoA-carboxylase] ligase [Bacteroidota bacterium]